jgi:hypothetical protein
MNQQQRAVVQQLMDAARVAGITVQCAVVQQQVSTALAEGKALLETEPVQDGWILVPVTPTNDMTSAMADALEDPNNERSSWDLAENMWHAMLPKVPTPPTQPAAWVDFDAVAAFCRVAFDRGAGDFNAGIDAMLAELKLREKNGGAAQQEPDMYWDDDDSERPASDSIHELLYDRWNNGGLEVGDEVSMTCAKQMEPLTVRVTKIDEDTYDIEYEVVKKGGTP